SNAFSIPSGKLGDMVRKTIFASSSDETRYVLNGVFWAASGGILEMVATDGRRLATVKGKLIPNDKDFRVIIPTKILQELLHLLNLMKDDEEQNILVSITDNQVAFQTKSTTMLS